MNGDSLVTVLEVDWVEVLTGEPPPAGWTLIPGGDRGSETSSAEHVTTNSHHETVS